jgi:signal transduction histidine kinase
MRGFAFYHEDHWFEMFGQIALTGKSKRFEFPAAELQRWFEGYAYRHGEVQERMVGILFNDITERKQAEAQLRQLKDSLEARISEQTEELTETQKRLRVLAEALTDTEQRERQRLAAELHDDLAQLLALTRMKLNLAKQQPMQPPLAKIITDADEIISKALTYTRTLISQLSPPAISEFGLPMALQWLTEQMPERGLSVSLDVKTQIPLMPEDHARRLFQSIRELLINCVKHAETHEATLTLEQADGSLYIHISDHGAGFDPLVSASKNGHSLARGFGLTSIRERMSALGGRFELKSSPGKGTTATLVLPLSDNSIESPSSLVMDRS